MSAVYQTDEAFLEDADAQRWTDIFSRVSCPEPANIDADLKPLNPVAAHGMGKTVYPDPETLPSLWHMKTHERPSIGILLDDLDGALPAETVGVMAARYAALSVEKQCEAVIMSHQNNSGFERFGFRVERIAGETEEAREDCVEQLRRFWGIEIVI